MIIAQNVAVNGKVLIWPMIYLLVICVKKDAEIIFGVILILKEKNK